jgi:TusA-related sulfurtransferase
MTPPSNTFATPSSSSSSHTNPFRLAPSSISYANEAGQNPQSSGLFPTSTAHSTASQVVRIEDLIDVIEEPPLTLDFRGLKCPMPIVQLSKHMRSTNKPLIRVSADDPAFPVDLKAWCEIHGYEIQQQQQQGSLFHAHLKRREGARLHLGSPKP